MLRLRRIHQFPEPKHLVPMVLVATLLIFGTRIYLQPQTLDPNYGIQSRYSFNYSDVSKPFTAYFVDHGNEASAYTGGITFPDSSAVITQQSGTVEWTFSTQKFFDAINNAKSSLTIGSFLVSEAHPTSPSPGSTITISLNGKTANQLVLDKQVGSTFTIDPQLQTDIPGSNLAYPTNFAVFDLTQALRESSTQNTIRVSLALTGAITWKLDTVALQLYSDYRSASSPWWTANLWSLVIAGTLLAIGLVALTTYARSSIIHFVGSKYKRLFQVSVVIGLITRLVPAPFLQGFADVDTYRNAGILSYYFGLDTRSFLSIYGSLWHGITLVSFPLSFLLQPVLGYSGSEILAVKIPLVLADLMIAFALLRLGTRLLTPRAGVVLAIGWLLNPYSIWMTGFWGILHPFATALAIVAIDRISSRNFFTGGILISSAVFSSLSLLVIVPPLILLTWPLKENRSDPKDFKKFFVGLCVASTLLFLLWDFSIAIFRNILFGPGRFGSDSLSPLSLVMKFSPNQVTTAWTLAGIPLGLSAVYLWQFSRRNRFAPDPMHLIDYPLATLLGLYLTAATVYPTYLLWSLPLISILVVRGIVRLGYYVMFQVVPGIWNLTYSFTDAPYNIEATIRIACETAFTIFLLLILVSLLKHRARPTEPHPAGRIWMSKKKFLEYEENLGRRSRRLEDVVLKWGKIRGSLYLWRYEFLTSILRSQDPHSLTIADVGSGDGYLSNKLTREGHHVVGVEFASSKVRIARQRSSDPDYVVADIENLPLKSNSIEAILCIEVIEHVSDPTKLLSGIFQALKPGGLLILTTPSLHMKHFRRNPISTLKSLLSLYNPRLLPRDRGLSEPDEEGRWVIDRAFSIQQVKALMVKAGLSNVRVLTMLYLPIFAAAFGKRALRAEQKTWSRVPVVNQSGITVVAIGRKPES